MRFRRHALLFILGLGFSLVAETASTRLDCEVQSGAPHSSAAPQLRWSVFLDADAVLINEEQDDRPRSEAHPEDYLEAAGSRYRAASFLPEFLYALKNLISFPGVEGVDISIFSGGPNLRNTELIAALEKSYGPAVQGIISRSLGFEHLTRVKELPASLGENPVQDAELSRKLRNLRTQDEWDFFATFKKSLSGALSQWEGPRDLQHSLIFDDNVDITPADEVPNVIAIARSNYNDEEHRRPYLEGLPAWNYLGKLRKPNKHPAQIARSRYRLIRALGLMDLLCRQVAQGEMPDLLTAATQAQWDERGWLKSSDLNQEAIYLRGMEIAFQAYEAMKATGGLNYERSTEEFSIHLLTARSVDSLVREAAYPWHPAPSRHE